MRVPRILVPADCPPPSGPPARPPKRLKTWLDSRTLIPQDMPVVPFEGVSHIPTHVPLDVLNNRIVIPRDMPVVPFPPELAASEPVITELDDRVVVPQDAHIQPTLVPEPFAVEVLQDLVEADLLVAGEPRLLPEKKGRINWDFLAPAFSVLFHVLLIIFFLTLPGMIRQYTANPIEEALNNQKLGYIYLPHNLKEIPRPKPVPQKPSDKMRLDIGARNHLAPPRMEVSPQQGPAPQPAPRVVPPSPPVQEAREAPQPRPEPAVPKPAPEPRLENVTPPHPRTIIAPPVMSPGQAIEQSLRAAARNAATPSYGFSDRLPSPPQMPGGQGQPGGAGTGQLSGSVQLLTPTDGVDFTSYIQRLLEVVRRNWYAVMPESALLGDQGRVMLRFKIMTNGSMPTGYPILEMTSGKRPLDRAAVAAITASNPFDPLPTAYTRPYIELRIMFLYNLPLPTQ